MDESYSSGPPITAIAIVVVAVAMLVVIAIVVLSSDATDQAQAQSQAQIAAERERTERMIAEQETFRHDAELRAENDARLTLLLAAGLAGLIIVCGLGAMVWGLNWSDNKQVERQLLILYASTHAGELPPPGLQPLRLTAKRTKERVWTSGR